MGDELTNMAMKAMKAAMKMKAMKMKAMKAAMKMKAMRMKAMKKKSVGNIAKGKMARAAVFAGRKEKTQSGLTKSNLTRNKQGKIVSKSRSALGKSAYGRSALKKWADATKAARKALGLKGFVPVGGSSATGKALYAKARSLLKARTDRSALGRLC